MRCRLAETPIGLCRAGLLLCLMTCAASDGKAQVTFGLSDVRSVFYISKSENRNQVRYGLRLDTRCRPQGDAPIYAYWQEREQGDEVVLPLSVLERRAYGILRQQVGRLQSRSGRVQLWLEAAQDRTIWVESYRDEHYRCQARALTRIGPESRAKLDHIYVKIGGFQRVEYVELRGQTLGGRAVRERIEP